MELRLPLDFERLPEFWQLTEALREAAQERNAAVGCGGHPLTPGRTSAWHHSPDGGEGERCQADVEATAQLLWLRLWIVLGYLARTTSRPGWLNAAGERQVNQAFRQFGDDCPPVQVLVKGTLLRPGDDGYYCDLFTKTNVHLSGSFLSQAERGNRRSLPARSKNMIGHEAMMQAQLLPPETFLKRTGARMEQREIDRSMVLIITLDRCLKQRARFKSNFTQGLLADACHVIEAVKPDLLARFYEWLAEVYDRPAMPKSAEEILRDWDRIFAVMKEEEGL